MPRGYASGVIISQPGQTREHARHTPRTESGMYKPPPVGADWTWNPPIIGADGAVLFFRLRLFTAPTGVRWDQNAVNVIMQRYYKKYLSKGEIESGEQGDPCLSM